MNKDSTKNGYQPATGTEAFLGLTKLEVFAMAALQGLCANEAHVENNATCSTAARAISYAEALLGEIDKAKKRSVSNPHD